MRVLVTGASGFVGTAAGAALARAGHRVRIACRAGSPSQQPVDSAETVLVGSIGPDTNWTHALRDIDVVLHLAARVHVMRVASTDVESFNTVNTAGTIALARQAQACGVRRFVFVSSIKVNGDATKGTRFRHTDEPAPSDAYARSKLAAERDLQAIRGLEAVIVRPPVVYGPNAKGNLARLCRLVQLGIPLPFGAVRNRRDLIYLENLVDLLKHCVECPAAAGQILLASDDCSLSTRDLCDVIAEGMGRRPRIFSLPIPLLQLAGRALGMSAEISRLTQSLEIDISHTREVLGWNPPYDSREGIRRMVQAYLGQKT